MSPQDGPDRTTGRVVDFDGLDDEADDGSDRQRVVSFDDLGSGSDTDDPRSRVVSFDDLDADAESDPRRSGVLSFDDEPDASGAGSPAPTTGRAAPGGPTVDDLLGGDDPGAGGSSGDIVSFDELDATGSRSTTRRARRSIGDRARDGGRRPTDTARDATTGAAARGAALDAIADAGRGAPANARTADPADEVAADDAGTGRNGRRRGGRGRDGGRAGRGGAGRGGAAAGPTSPQDDESRAREICLRLLTDRARTVKELSDTLRRKEIPDDVANRVLERFDEVGLVDDEAFAGQWVRSRHRHKGLGRRAIAMELHRKGVDREIADEALNEIDPESEQARARELVDRRLRTMRVETKDDRASAARRLVGMLARKGYGSGVAYGVVREAIAAKGAEEDELGDAPVGD